MDIEKLNWDVYFMTMAFAASRRSIDPSTKVGCLIVSETKRILSTGYNGPMRGSDDEFVTSLLDKRPDKYYIMIHAEENAVTTYSGSEQDITGSTAYVTCAPCHRCLRMLGQKGIRRVVYSDAPGAQARMLDEEEARAQRLVLRSARTKQLKDLELVSLPYAGVLSNIDAMRLHVTGKPACPTLPCGEA